MPAISVLKELIDLGAKWIIMLEIYICCLFHTRSSLQEPCLKNMSVVTFERVYQPCTWFNLADEERSFPDFAIILSSTLFKASFV